MKILVLNAGSSSIKYKLYEMPAQTVLASGLVERIGEETARILHEADAHPVFEQERSIPTHQDGLAQVVDLLLDEALGVIGSPDEITAIGHRVVHGGEKFSAPTRIDDEVLAAIEALIPLAPLHNPANLAGIRVAQGLFPLAVQVAIFDTAFHQTLPPRSYRYAIPKQFYEQDNIRVYGFHGTSHQYVARTAARHLETAGFAQVGHGTGHCNLITAHLGNGASMTAVENGHSVDTSLGFSPLPGLIMGTRSGDIDPAVVFFLANQRGMSIAEIDRMLNKQSGLLGLCGDNDLRDIEARMAAGDPDAALAFEMYTYRIRKYIGAFTAVLGHTDALVFTAGVGENSAAVRAAACRGLEGLGYEIDPLKNARGKQSAVTEIQNANSRAKILIIPTNEELEIARQTDSIISD